MPTTGHPVARAISIAFATGLLAAALTALGGCREQQAAEAVPALASSGVLADPCIGDSLRPASGAPPSGLWFYEQRSGKRVAAMIGPLQPDSGTLTVTRPVESIEVSPSGDTIRYHVDAATVSLELLPPWPTLGGRATSDSAAGAHPAATFAVSPRVRLAAYEPCAASRRPPRIRYIRRDGAGHVVTDVMLFRASEQ